MEQICGVESEKVQMHNPLGSLPHSIVMKRQTNLGQSVVLFGKAGIPHLAIRLLLRFVDGSSIAVQFRARFFERQVCGLRTQP